MQIVCFFLLTAESYLHNCFVIVHFVSCSIAQFADHFASEFLVFFPLIFVSDQRF